MNMLTVSIIQRIFFPNTKIVPKQGWKDKLKQYGSVDEFRISRKNKFLSCVYVYNKNSGKAKKSKIAILGHPVSKKGKYFFTEGERIKHYLKKGYNVVIFDFNGFGESDRIDLFYWQDSMAVIQYVIEHYKPVHLILHGCSFASFQVIPSIKFLPKGSSVVLENTSLSLYDYWEKWFITRNAVVLCEFLSIQGAKDMNVIEVLKNFSRKDISFTFIGCTNDKYTRLEEMKQLASFS